MKYLLCALLTLPFLLQVSAQEAESPVTPTTAAGTDASSDELDDDTLLGQFHAGGVWMYPILACSFVCVAFLLERLVNLRRSKIIPPDLLSSISKDLGTEDLKSVKDACQNNDSSLGRVLLAGLERAGLSLAEMERVADEQSARELYGLRRNIKPLGIVASVSPMIGLLGTVNGMISAFRVVAEHGAVGDPKLLSGSISKALLTTGFGLMVAIPALLVHHHFRGKADNLIVEISEITNRIFIKFENFHPATKDVTEVKEQEVA